MRQTQKSGGPICEFQRNTILGRHSNPSKSKDQRERKQIRKLVPKVDGFFAGWAGLQLASSTSNARYLPITPWRGLRRGGPDSRDEGSRNSGPRKFSLVCNNRSQNLSRGCFPRSTLCQEQLRVYSTLRCAPFSGVWVLLAVQELERLYQCTTRWIVGFEISPVEIFTDRSQSCLIRIKWENWMNCANLRLVFSLEIVCLLHEILSYL